MTNIYDKSGLSRQTFYNFFDDKEDVVRRCIHDLLQSARSDDKTDEEEFLDTAKRYLKVLDEHTAFFRTVIDQRLDYIIRSEIVTLLIDLLNRLAPQNDPHANAYRNAYLSGAITAVLVH